MKLEIDFFCAQPVAQPTVVPLIKEHNPEEDHLILFSDFDLTCTVVDSSAILAEIAIVTAPKSDQNQPECQLSRMSSAELKNTWGLLSGQYTEEYEQCIESILPSKEGTLLTLQNSLLCLIVGKLSWRNSFNVIDFSISGFDFLDFAVKEFNYEALHKALQQLSDFEKRANSRVIESGVLKGISLEDIKRAGERLILQNGCTSFLQKIVKNENLNANVHVLSYCWCGDLIRASFSSGMLHPNRFVVYQCHRYT